MQKYFSSNKTVSKALLKSRQISFITLKAEVLQIEKNAVSLTWSIFF